uniref:protein-serine/threonine phosphatase n=1 Tax=Sus scrofa TaxID=9823 RepID=A0A8D1C8B7_PIG
MGAYLSQPNTVKCSGDGVGASRLPLPYGFSAMQGWRVSMEDAHNCIPELDSETAMFSVYDGHGGEEVALYCAKYLPDIIKDQKAYKEGKLQKALEDAFLAIDAKLTTEEVIKELAQIAGRPTEDEDEKEKVADEDDVDNEEAALLHEEATMTIEELLTRYGQNCHKGAPHSKSGAGTGEEAGSQGLNGEAGPEDPSRETSSEENGPTAKAHTGLSSNSERGTEAGQGGEPGTPTGEAGPSCSSASDKLPRVAKSKFFEDSEDESDEAEEEEEDSEECSEEEDGYSSEEAENEEDEDDTEEAEEDEEEEEEMMVPGMEGKEEPGSDSGTTAVVALIRGKQLIVANAGDSRCVVSEAGKALDMSYDHKPEDEVELARIKNAGGKVTMDGRVNGGLNLSRAIGDHFYKRNKNLPPEFCLFPLALAVVVMRCAGGAGWLCSAHSKEGSPSTQQPGSLCCPPQLRPCSLGLIAGSLPVLVVLEGRTGGSGFYSVNFI